MNSSSGLELPKAVAIFLAVGQSNSLTAAARKLGISTSGVSRAISRLESRLGTPLINRNTRRIGLTTEGMLFFERFQQLTIEMQEIEVAFNQATTGVAGQVRLMIAPAFGREVVVPLLSVFAKKHPAIRLEILLDSGPVDLIEERIHLALQMEKPIDSRLIAKPLGQFMHILCAAPNYLATYGTPKTRKDLTAGHVAVTYMHPRSSWTRGWELGPRNTLVRLGMPNIMRVSDLHTLRDAAIAGAGLAYLPHFMVRDALKKGTLKRVLDDFQDRTSVYMIYSSHSIRLPRVRALTDYLSTHLKTPGRGPANRSSVLGPEAPSLGAR